MSSRVDDLAMRLVQARSYIHSTLSLEYGLVDEPSEPQLAFHRFQAEVVEKEEAMRVATVEISIAGFALYREGGLHLESKSGEGAGSSSTFKK